MSEGRYDRRVQNDAWVENVDRETFLSHNTRTWGHPMKLIGGRFSTDKRKYFTLCIVELWNSLPQHVVMVNN